MKEQKEHTSTSTCTCQNIKYPHVYLLDCMADEGGPRCASVLTVTSGEKMLETSGSVTHTKNRHN